MLPFLETLVSLCMVLVSASFWSVVTRLRRGHMRVLNRRLTQWAQCATAALDGSGRTNALNGVMIDVAEPKRSKVRQLAHVPLRDIPLEDSLTGLFNRRQFDLSLAHEFKRAVRGNLPLGLVLIDLDHFQAYNELYDQAAG